MSGCTQLAAAAVGLTHGPPPVSERSIDLTDPLVHTTPYGLLVCFALLLLSLTFASAAASPLNRELPTIHTLPYVNTRAGAPPPPLRQAFMHRTSGELRASPFPGLCAPSLYSLRYTAPFTGPSHSHFPLPTFCTAHSPLLPPAWSPPLRHSPPAGPQGSRSSTVRTTMHSGMFHAYYCDTLRYVQPHTLRT